MIRQPPEVAPSGPLDAPIAWVGESPGPDEERQGKPFVGASGQMARKALARLGLSPDNDVRWLNVCRTKVLPWPSGYLGAQLIYQWAPRLDADLAELTGCRVIVACGAVSLARMTGHTDIGSWWGSVLRRTDVPASVRWHKRLPEYTLTWPEGAVVIPIWHPAGILRDPGRTSTPELLRTVEKVARYLRGQLEKPVAVNRFYPSVEELDAALCRGRF